MGFDEEAELVKGQKVEKEKAVEVVKPKPGVKVKKAKKEVEETEIERLEKELEGLKSEEVETDPLDLGVEEGIETTIVVKELPTQQIRKHKDEKTGKITNFVTIEEALTDMENYFRKLSGGV